MGRRSDNLKNYRKHRDLSLKMKLRIISLITWKEKKAVNHLIRRK